MPIQRRILMPGQEAPPRDPRDPRRNTFIGTPGDPEADKVAELTASPEFSKLQEMLKGGNTTSAMMREAQMDAARNRTAAGSTSPDTEEEIAPSEEDKKYIKDYMKGKDVPPSVLDWMAHAHADPNKGRVEEYMRDMLQDDFIRDDIKDHIQQYGRDHGIFDKEGE